MIMLLLGHSRLHLYPELIVKTLFERLLKMPRVEIPIEEKVRISLSRQTVLPDSSLRTRFGDVVRYCKFHEPSDTIGHDDVIGDEVKLGSITYVGGYQRIRSVNVTHDLKNDTLSLQFNHEVTWLGVSYHIPLSIVGDLWVDGGENNPDEMFYQFAEIVRDRFVERVVVAIHRGKISEKDFFDDTSRLFSAKSDDEIGSVIDEINHVRDGLVDMLDFLDPMGEPRYIPANIDYIWMDVVKKVELLKAKIGG